MYKDWYNIQCPNKNLQAHVSQTVKTFIELQFGYSLHIWIFCGRSSNIRISPLHERTLKALINKRNRYKTNFKQVGYQN